MQPDNKQDDQLKDKLDAKIIRNLIGNKGKAVKRINGALKQVIHDHGPITTTNYPSASKRIIGNLFQLINDIRKQVKANHDAQELNQLQFTNEQLLELAKTNPPPKEWYDEEHPQHHTDNPK